MRLYVVICKRFQNQKTMLQNIINQKYNLNLRLCFGYLEYSKVGKAKLEKTNM